MYLEDSEFQKSIKALSELLRRERDISRIKTFEELEAKKLAIKMVTGWMRDVFNVEIKIEEPDSGIEDLFVFKK